MRYAASIAAACLLAPAVASAATVLGFERVNLTYPSATYAQIQGFYNGGTSSVGTSGTNFGITFGPKAVAVCLNALGGNCSNASRGGLSATSSQGALGLQGGGSTYLNFASAYTGAIAFSYQVDVGFVGSITAYSGLGGTGAALGSGTLFLFNTNGSGCPAYNAAMCPLGPGGLGVVSGAQSIVFTGAPGHVVFDDLTFGAGNDPLPPPAYVPEPSTWALSLMGFAALGGLLRRQRRALSDILKTAPT